jgi:rhodanese-related sulfurtransferase
VLGLGLSLSFVVAARSANVWKPLISARFPKVEWIDAETLAKWMESSSSDELVLLDVRTPEEQRVSHLRGAEYLDPGDPDIEALGIPIEATVVVYCSIGYRSAAVVSSLKKAGIRQVYNLEGGLFDWANQDREVVRGDERVHEVHPFNRLWGLLLRSELRSKDSQTAAR